MNFKKLMLKKFKKVKDKNYQNILEQLKKEVINLIKKLKDKNANGEDSRLIGIRLKEIETEHLTQANINKEISWSPKIGDFNKN